LRAAAQPEPDRDLPHAEDGHRDPEQDGEHEHTRVLPGEHECPHEDVRRSCEPLDQPIVVAVERGPDELQDPVCEKRQADGQRERPHGHSRPGERRAAAREPDDPGQAREPGACVLSRCGQLADAGEDERRGGQPREHSERAERVGDQRQPESHAGEPDHRDEPPRQVPPE